MSSPHSPASVLAAERRRDELSTILTTLRLRTQLLHRLAQQADGPAWPRMAAGLRSLDGDLTTLLRQLDAFEPLATR